MQCGKVWVKNEKCGWKANQRGANPDWSVGEKWKVWVRQIREQTNPISPSAADRFVKPAFPQKYSVWLKSTQETWKENFPIGFFILTFTSGRQPDYNNVNFKTLDLVLIAWILKSKFLHWGMSDLSRMHFLKKVSMLLKSCEEKSKVNISIGGSQICQTFQTFAHGTLSPTYTFIKNNQKYRRYIKRSPPRPPKDQQLPILSKAPPAL